MSSELHLTFLHANGYPAGVYRQFFKALRSGATVAAPEILATANDCPPGRRWPEMLRQSLAAARHQLHALPAQSGAPASIALVGHSMGGYLALQAAAELGAQVDRVVLIDSPIPTGWRASILSVSQLTGLAYRAGPAPIAARRRDRWPSRAAAREFFAGKAFVKQWATGVLDDFIEHALVADGDGVSLRIPRDSERDIYAHIVHGKARRALHALRTRGVPVHFIAGERSEEVRMAGREANRALFAPNFSELPYGHLIPMEAPDACAHAVITALQAGDAA